MVKTPRTRHYKPPRKPVTIDLAANASEPIEPWEAERPGDSAGDAGAVETAGAAEAVEARGDSAAQAWMAETSEAIATDEIQEGPSARSIDDLPTGEATPDTRSYAVEESLEERADTESLSLRGERAEQSFGRRDEAAFAGAPAVTTAPPPRRGILSMLAAGLLGGAIALAGAGLLQFAGLLGAPSGSPAQPGVSQADLDALKTEITALKSAPPAEGGADVTALTESLEQLRTDVGTLQSAGPAQGDGGAAMSALDAKVKELEAAIGQLSQAENSTASGADLSALQQSVAGLSAKVDAQTAQPKVALAIAAASLKSALDRGSAFTAELETFAAISPSAPEIEALRTRAEAGVMTRDDIAKAFPTTANAMIAAAKPVDPNAGIFERLLSSAESVVKVRPVGEVAGEEPPQRIARMEVAINAGDYDKALAEFAALPENVQAAGAELVDKIKARVEVEKLVDQMIAGAMKAA